MWHKPHSAYYSQIFPLVWENQILQKLYTLLASSFDRRPTALTLLAHFDIFAPGGKAVDGLVLKNIFCLALPFTVTWPWQGHS